MTCPCCGYDYDEDSEFDGPPSPPPQPGTPEHTLQQIYAEKILAQFERGDAMMRLFESTK